MNDFQGLKGHLPLFAALVGVADCLEAAPPGRPFRVAVDRENEHGCVPRVPGVDTSVLGGGAWMLV